MRECEIPRAGVLPVPVQLTVDEAAEDLARSYGNEAELLGWFDGKAGRYYPDTADCLEGMPPSWVQFAESRGGNLTVDVNHGRYVFVFRGRQGLS